MLILLFCLLMNEGAEQHFEVRQVTAEMLYLAVGEGKPPAIGAQLTIHKDGRLIATLEVVSASSRFISCKLLSSSKPVAVGDIASYQAPTSPQEPVAQKPAPAPDQPPKQSATYPARKAHRSPIRGTIAMQYYRYDAAGNGSSYSQPTLRISLRSEDLADGLIGFQLRTRSRYTDRSNGTTNGDWNNIIYKASVRIGRDQSRFQLQAGRLISNTFSGAGYLDGGVVRMRIGQYSQVGLFAGVQPDWQRPDGAATIDKYGAYFNFTRGLGRSYFNSTVALAGEYEAGEINREFAFFGNRFDSGRLSLYQSAELDINRDWRSEAAGESLSLTNLFLQSSFRQNERLSWSLGYDKRQAFITWDLRNSDEILFENYARQGWRAGLQAKLYRQFRLDAGAGINTRNGDADTKTWYFNLNNPNLFPGGWGLRARANGFTNGYTKGLAPALHFGKRWGAGQQVWLGYSSYRYEYLLTGEKRDNSYLKFEYSLNFGKYFFMGGECEYNTGDDAEGSRVYLDFGVRL